MGIGLCLNPSRPLSKHASERDQLQLAAYAFMDGLTGIPNRRSFDDQAAEEFERCLRRLLILDVDHQRPLWACSG